MAIRTGPAGRLTIGELCSVAYALLAERVERRALAAYTVAGVAQALGADVELPDPDRWRSELDTALAAEPKTVDSDQDVLLSALGLGDR